MMRLERSPRRVAFEEQGGGQHPTAGVDKQREGAVASLVPQEASHRARGFAQPCPLLGFVVTWLVPLILMGPQRTSRGVVQCIPADDLEEILVHVCAMPTFFHRL